MPTKRDVQRTRGDTYPDVIVIKDSKENPIDCSGWEFRLTVSTVRTPTDESSRIFQLTGRVVGDDRNVVEFPLLPTQADQDADVYWYEVKAKTSEGILTIATGQYVFVQDITKSTNW